MTEFDKNTRISEIENRLSQLPQGTLTYKTIKGKKQPYLQRTENGKSVSYYIKLENREQILMEIEERNELLDELSHLKKYHYKIAEILSRQPRMKVEYGIGYQDFAQLIESEALYIDKTDFIEEWWESKDPITLITRPRRFGKTLMLSTVDYFFSSSYANQKKLFAGLKVWKNKDLRKQMGDHQVVFFSFGSVKGERFEDSVWTICNILWRVYDDFSYLSDNPIYCKYKEGVANNDSRYVEDAIVMLCKAIYDYCGQMPLVLLDEYDTPIQEAFLSGYWDEMISFIRRFFNASFKTNNYLGKTLMTGIARISKESLFSDLNNLSVYTVTSDKYAKYFGFTEQEVDDILDFGSIEEKQKVKDFYDGFSFGGEKSIFNPWSILCYARERLFKCFWIHTGGTSLISKLILQGDNNLKLDIEALLRGESIHKKIDENITFDELYKVSETIWPLLLCTGYLKAENIKYELDVECDLSVTNQETVLLFRDMVEKWFGQVNTEYNNFCKYLLEDDVEGMEEFVNYVALSMVSFFDVGKRPSEMEPERFYHGLVLGMMVTLRDRYSITSNRESGRGRYDIMLCPLEENLPAIIIEFKVFNPKKEQSLEETAENALSQIIDKNYEQKLVDHGIPEDRIRMYGFGFRGKEVVVRSDKR